MSKNAAAAAADLIVASQVTASVTTPNGQLPDDAPATKFDRLSVERRVLGTINDDPHTERLGARNHLAAIADFVLSDPNTVNAPPPNHRLDVAGLSLADAVQKVLDHLERLIDAGLVSRNGDAADANATYSLTKAGVTELQS